jgi:uncharacterized protein YjiS (DUF1127 family)
MSAHFARAEDRPETTAAELLRGLGHAVSLVVLRLLAARNRARTRRILSGLDDAMLKDIGVTRGEIDAVERDPRYEPKFPGL